MIIVVVLPEPGHARSNSGPCVLVTAFFCILFSSTPSSCFFRSKKSLMVDSFLRGNLFHNSTKAGPFKRPAFRSNKIAFMGFGGVACLALVFSRCQIFMDTLFFVLLFARAVRPDPSRVR